MMQLLLVFLLIIPQEFNWVSFNVVKRINKSGVTSWMDSRIHFDQNGKMVTYFTKPDELYVINNKDGELKVYNPSQNSVYQAVNFNYSSQHSPIYYFLNDVEDMGLDKANYTLSDSKVDDQLLISKWLPPFNADIDLSYIEIVNDGEKNIFQAFYDDEGSCFKKVYYYNFELLGDRIIPKAITEIDYIDSDSVITKTSFSEFILNDPIDREVLDLVIPQDAKLLGG